MPVHYKKQHRKAKQTYFKIADTAFTTVTTNVWEKTRGKTKKFMQKHVETYRKLHELNKPSEAQLKTTLVVNFDLKTQTWHTSLQNIHMTSCENDVPYVFKCSARVIRTFFTMHQPCM